MTDARKGDVYQHRETKVLYEVLRVSAKSVTFIMYGVPNQPTLKVSHEQLEEDFIFDHVDYFDDQPTYPSIGESL